MTEHKKILCLDFDGVVHSHTSKWVEAYFIPDPPVPGAFEFIWNMQMDFDVHIYSSRTSQPGGIEAMRAWMRHWCDKLYGPERTKQLMHDLKFPTEKPPAHLTIDDRAVTFTGTWPTKEWVTNFKPWNK